MLAGAGLNGVLLEVGAVQWIVRLMHHVLGFDIVPCDHPRVQIKRVPVDLGMPLKPTPHMPRPYMEPDQPQILDEPDSEGRETVGMPPPWVWSFLSYTLQQLIQMFGDCRLRIAEEANIGVWMAEWESVVLLLCQVCSIHDLLMEGLPSSGPR